MPVITPNIPEGLIELMKTFAKCVLKEKPENIYEFSVVHFENLLKERDGDLNKGYERFAASEKYLEAQEKCMLSQITSHLSKKSKLDPVKIPPNDGTEEDVSLSETLSPKSLQHKFRPRKLSSRKASETLLSIKEEDEGHNPSEELALQHGKLNAARRIQRAYKSYRKRKEERENGAALIIQRTLKKLFGSKLGGAKVLQNDGESTCSNIQNDSGVESDVPKDETEGEHENHKELNVGAKKYMDSDLAINFIITQQVPSFTEDECRSQNLEFDKVEKPSVGNLDEADTIVRKERSVDGESSVHKDSKIESSSSKQVDIQETQLNEECERTEDIAEVDAANPKLDHNHITDAVVKAEILEDVEEQLKTEAAEAGKLILERECRFVSNDTNNIGSAELVSDVQNKKGDDIEDKGNGFSEAILEEVARNGSKNDISKETIEFIKSPRENEDGNQNSEETGHTDKNSDEKEFENALSNEEKVINVNNGHGNDKKEEKSEANLENRNASNDIEEGQPQLNLTENKDSSQGNIEKETQMESVINNEVKNEDLQKINNDKHVDSNGIKNGNGENKDEDSVSPKSVWYVGSEPIITSKSSEGKDESNSFENSQNISNEKSNQEKLEQVNNSTIIEGSKTDLTSANELLENNDNNSNQEYPNNNIENGFEKSIKKISQDETEQKETDKSTSDTANENEEISETLHNEISSKEVESDKNVVDEDTNGIKNEENIIKKHTEPDEGDQAVPEIIESSTEKLENYEGKEIPEKDTDPDSNVANENSTDENSEHKQGDEEEKDQIIINITERNLDNVKNSEEILGKASSENSIEKLINDEEKEILTKDFKPDNKVVDKDRIPLKNEELGGNKHPEGDEEDQTISEAERNMQNIKNEQEISTGSGSENIINTDTSENQNEEVSESKNIESSELLPSENENDGENIKNGEDKEEQKGQSIPNESNSVDKGETLISNKDNKEIRTDEADDGDKNAEEKEETLKHTSSEEIKESTDISEIENASQEVITNLSEDGKGVENCESHTAQDKPNNSEELVNEVETEKCSEETKDGIGNKENKVLNQENLPSGEDENEGKIDSQKEASTILSEDDGDQHGTNTDRTEVIEEEIKKVVAPSRFASPGKIITKEYKDSEDKIIAKELLQHASDKDVDIPLKENQNKSEEQVAYDENTEIEKLQAENKTDQNFLNTNPAVLETKLTDSNSTGSLNNHIQDDNILDIRSIDSNTSNEHNNSHEDKDEEKVIQSKGNSKEEIDETEINKPKSQSLKSELPKLEPNEELYSTKENDTDTVEKNLNNKIYESTKFEKIENPTFDIKEDKERKRKEERDFEGFIIEPAFKDNDGGNTGINPDENVKHDSNETSDPITTNEQQENSRPQMNAPAAQNVEISSSKDDKQNDTNADDKVEIVDGSQENCEAEKLTIDLSKDENKPQNENIFLMQRENENTINNSENVDKNESTNTSNNINQEQEENAEEKQTTLTKEPQKIIGGKSAENNDLKNENNLEVNSDNIKPLHPPPDNELKNKNIKNDVNIIPQIEEKKDHHEGDKIDDVVIKEKEVNKNSGTELMLPRDRKEEACLNEEEGSLKMDKEYNFENIKQVVETSNKENEYKTIDKPELERPVDKIDIRELNAETENIHELTDNENAEKKEVSDKGDTEFPQDTVEETQLSKLSKSTFETKENSEDNVDVKAETMDSEKETKTIRSLEKPSEKTDIAESPSTKIYEQEDNICVEKSKERFEQFNENTLDLINQDKENREETRNQIEDKEDINSLDKRRNSSNSSQLKSENSINETDGGSGVEKNMENNLEEAKNGEDRNKEQNQSKTINEEIEVNKTGIIKQTNNDLDDVDKSNQNKKILDTDAEKQKSIEDSDKQATTLGKEDNVEDENVVENEKLEKINCSKYEKENIENSSSFSENIVKEGEKEEDIEASKKVEDTDTNNEERELNSNAQLNKTYTISKNKRDETVDHSEENKNLKKEISPSSSLVSTLSNEPSADNEVLSQKFKEKFQGEEMVEVQEEPTIKQVSSSADISKVHSPHLSDIEINREEQNLASLNGQSNDKTAQNEDSTEKFENKKIKAEINEEPTARQFATTSEIHSASLSDTETARVESRSTINDELSEIENIDISTYGEDSLEAMYYSLRKNEIMLDRMQKRASERKSASKERGPIEKLDLRQVKSMSEMSRSMSINSDDDIVIKTLERNKSDGNDVQQFNNPISVVAQKTARLLESMHQMNSNPANPTSTSFEEERVVRPPCRMYSPSIRMKSRIPTPIKDFPKSVSFETPLAAAQRKSQKFMQRLHNDTQSSETVDSLLDQKETSDTIRQKMLAYSVSEADSDCCVEGEQKMGVMHDDSNVSTALETASTDTDSTIVSAATKIQAGARGFLTRRRLRRASDGALPQESDRKASFGNEAIGESLEDLVEQNAASKIQKSYRRYLGKKQHKSESSKPSPETSSSSKSSDGSKPVGITQVKIGQKRDRDESDDAKKADDIDDGYHGAYFEGLNLAERRMTLQRGDAVQKYSTPEEENGFSLTTGRQVSDAGDSKPTTSPKKRKPVKNDTWRNFGLRQRTMPVQIESDILRVVPKHMRKRIKSADAQKNSRQIMQ